MATMNNILSKLKIKSANTTAVPAPVASATVTTSTISNANIAGTVTSYTPTYTSIGTTGVVTSGYAAIAGGGAGPGTILTSVGAGSTMWMPPTPTHPVVISNQGKEIVRVEKDGTIVWSEGIKIDEAAEAFAKTISLSTEMKAAITERVKADMRNRIFEEIINISKEKGSLTTDELTLMLEATKIMEKLKGL